MHICSEHVSKPWRGIARLAESLSVSQEWQFHGISYRNPPNNWSMLENSRSGLKSWRTAGRDSLVGQSDMTYLRDRRTWLTWGTVGRDSPEEQPDVTVVLRDSRTWLLSWGTVGHNSPEGHSDMTRLRGSRTWLTWGTFGRDSWGTVGHDSYPNEQSEMTPVLRAVLYDCSVIHRCTDSIIVLVVVVVCHESL